MIAAKPIGIIHGPQLYIRHQQAAWEWCNQCCYQQLEIKLLSYFSSHNMLVKRWTKFFQWTLLSRMTFKLRTPWKTEHRRVQRRSRSFNSQCLLNMIPSSTNLICQQLLSSPFGPQCKCWTYLSTNVIQQQHYPATCCIPFPCHFSIPTSLFWHQQDQVKLALSLFRKKRW